MFVSINLGLAFTKNKANLINAKQSFLTVFLLMLDINELVCLKRLEEFATLKNLEVIPFFYLTFGIVDRYKICIGVGKLIKGTVNWHPHLKY